MAAEASIDAYLEYRRIVGDDDGGHLFSEREYEHYKREKIPARIKNRLFVSWTNSVGIDCKLIGPETMCFCKHRYRQHKTDFPEIPAERPLRIPCRENKCGCPSFCYLPWSGGGPIRCSCKHSADDHHEDARRRCRKEKCNCNGFRSSYPCACTEKYSEHSDVVETKEERQRRGKPVGDDVPYQAMGGITGFSSLIDGYMRLDPSGIGPPSKDTLDKEIIKEDHPFLRIHAGAGTSTKTKSVTSGRSKAANKGTKK